MQHLLGSRTARLTAGIGAGGLIAGGALTLLLGGGGAALAASTPAGGTPTTVTATVAESTSLTDNTPAIDFGTLALGQPNQASPNVSLTINTNDQAGYSTSATLLSSGKSGLWSGPSGMTADQFTIQGNGPTPVAGDSTTGAFANIDSSTSGVTNGALSDTVIDHPNGNQPPGNYSGTLLYSVTPG